MDAVIDPSGPTCVSFVQTGTVLYNDFATFDLVPVTNDLVGKPLKVEKVDGLYVLAIDDTAVIDAQWASVRAQQRELLYKSDWTCSVTDYEVPNKSEWVQYRQALRDVTTQSDPFAIVWPTAPV
jgi:hypothetical protein